MVIDLWVEIALHDFLVVHIVCAYPAAWGIGDLHQTAAFVQVLSRLPKGEINSRRLDPAATLKTPENPIMFVLVFARLHVLDFSIRTPSIATRSFRG